MILERLQMERVRRFSPGFTCTFSPGLNAVFGPNESGKSTIFQSLLAVLFWDPKSTKEEVRSLYSWKDETPFVLKLNFRASGSRYLLCKDFQKKEVLLVEEATGRVWRDSKTAQGQINELLGLPRPEVYACSAAVAQGMLELPSRGKDKKALDEALAEVMTGGADGGGAARAIELLTKEIQSLTVGLKDKAFKTPGPIRAVEERLKVLQGRNHALAASLAQRVSNQRALVEAEAEIIEVGSTLENKRALLDIESERTHIKAQLEEHKKRYEDVESRFRALEENSRRLQTMEEAIDQMGRAAQLEEDDLVSLRAAVARRDGLIRPIQEARETLQGMSVPGRWGALALASLGILAPLIAGTVGPWPTLKVASVVLGLALLGVAGWLWHRRKAQVEAFEEKRAGLRRSEAELEEIEAWLREFLERLNAGSAEGVLRGAKEADRAREEREKLLSEKRGILGNRSEEAIGAERAELLRRMAVMEERLREARFAGPALDAESYTALSRETEALSAEREELSKRIERLRGVLEASADEAEELAELDEAIEQAGAELRRRRRSLRVRELARSALEEAQQAALAPAAGRFQQVLGRYLSVISKGRYSEVRLGDDLSDLKVLGIEREAFLEPKVLSFGTAEQLLLAARLTLTDMLAGAKRPPLLLDEPFGSFDEGRLMATIDLLSSIAHERQVILFTHQEAVASACKHVVALPLQPAASRGEDWEKTL